MKILFACMIFVAAFATRVDAQCTDYAWQDALISTTDFSTGSTSSLNHFKVPTNNVEPISSDAVIRQDGQLVYVVNRGSASNIQILVPCDNYNTVHQWSTGNGSNPHDIAFYSSKMYVSRYDMTSILVMNPQTGATITTISLAQFADADGIPEMDQMFFAGGHLCVLLQRLDRNNFYTPTGTSFIVRIDPSNDTVIPILGGSQPVELARTNPYSEVNFNVLDGVLSAYFSAIGFFGVLDGAVLGVSLTDPTLMQTVVLTEAAAGGDILDVEIISDTKGFAIVATPSFVTQLIAFNPSTGLKIGSTMYAPGGYDLSDCEPSPLGLLLTDRKPTNPGIRCFDMDTLAQIPGGPIDVGLPPFDILVSYDWLTGIGNSPLASRLGQNYPNPFNPETSIPFFLARGGNVTLRVFDVSGRLVATLVDERRAAGGHVAPWDGHTNTGTIAPTGVYFARLEANGATATQKLVLLK